MSIDLISSTNHWAEPLQAAANIHLPSLTQKSCESDVYTSTIASQIEEKQQAPSFIKRVGEWFMSLFGAKITTNMPPLTGEQIGVAGIGGAPKLDKADATYLRDMADSLNKVNHELTHRLEDTRRFEEEMGTTGHKDQSLLWEIFQRSLAQKALKEDSGLLLSADTHRKLSHNEEIKEETQKLLDEVKDWAKKNKIPEWIGYISSAGTAGVIAVSFATGGVGAVFTLAIPLFTLTKGLSSAARGLINHTNEKRQGELFMLNHRRNKNSTDIQQNVDKLKTIDNDRLAVIKMIKEALKNYHKTAQIIKK